MSQRLLKLFHVAITQHVPRILVRAPMIMPKYPSTARLLSSSHAVLKKSKGGSSTVKNTEPMDVTPQLDLDEVVTQMFSAVKHCGETVRSMVGSLGRIDASILDDVRVSTGKGVKPTPLHDYATVGVRDDVLVITAFDSSSLKHIEKAVYALGRDLAPQIMPDEEDVMIVHVPKPTGETRKMLLQRCIKECDHAKTKLRSVRQAAQKHMKHDMDNKLLSKNDSQREAKKVCGIYMLTL